MSTTILLPDSISTNTFNAGGLTDIDEGTGSPDALWCTVASTSDSPVVRVGFPGLSNPTDKVAGTQTVNLWIRKFDATGGGNPTATVTIYDNGSLLTTSTINNSFIPDNTTGALMTGTWSSAGIGDETGANIEFNVAIATNGGGPNRRTGELGAVDWEVNYIERRIIKFS